MGEVNSRPSETNALRVQKEMEITVNRASAVAKELEVRVLMSDVCSWA